MNNSNLDKNDSYDKESYYLNITDTLNGAICNLKENNQQVSNIYDTVINSLKDTNNNLIFFKEIITFERDLVAHFLKGTAYVYKSLANEQFDSVMSNDNTDIYDQKMIVALLLRINDIGLNPAIYFETIFKLEQQTSQSNLNCIYEYKAILCIRDNLFEKAYERKRKAVEIFKDNRDLEVVNNAYIMLRYLEETSLYAKAAAKYSDFRKQYHLIQERLSVFRNKDLAIKNIINRTEIEDALIKIRELLNTVYKAANPQKTSLMEGIHNCEKYIELISPKKSNIYTTNEDLKNEFVKLRAGLILRERTRLRSAEKIQEFDKLYDINKYEINDIAYKVILEKVDLKYKSEVNNLFALQFYIDRVFDLITVKQDEYEDIIIAYYTRLNTFQFLLDIENRLSVMNVEYMNDPNEGKVLFKYIFDQSKKKEDRDKYNNEFVFLKSFTDKVDYLSMWSLYGDDAKGCCVYLDGKMFNNIADKLQLLKEVCPNKKDIISLWEGSNLYRVVYLKGNEFYLQGEKNAILQSYFNNIKVKTKKLLGYEKLVNLMLAKIKYMVKYHEYQDENEIRIITSCSGDQIVALKNGVETILNNENKLQSKLYVPFPLKTRINEVILGPKVLNKNEYVPYMLNKFAIMNQGLSEDTILSISSIDYR